MKRIGAAAAAFATVACCAAVTLAPAKAATGGGFVVSVPVHSDLGAVNEALLGTNQPVDSSQAESLVAQLGIAWARTDMSLDASYACASGTWDPASLDTRVRDDLAMGGTPELIVDYSPPCMTSNPLHETLDPPDAAGYGPWESLVEQVAYHEMTAFGVRVFEVWNEPDGTFWHGTLADYLAMYKATATAITAAAQRAGISGVSIGGPALLFADPAWLEPFLAYVSTNHLPLGFVSWHYYGDYPALGPFATGAGVVPPEVPGAGPYWYNPATTAQTYALQVQQVKEEIAKYPGLDPRTVIDEWNLDAGYDPRSDQPYDAAFAAAVLTAVQSAGLDRMAFFRVADDRPGTLGNWGMLFSNFAPKPVYWTFAFWHALAGTRLSATTAPSGGDVGAVASASAGGALSVLVYNYAPNGGAQAPVTVRFRGLAGAWSYTVRMVGSTSNGDQLSSGGVTGPDASISLQMPVESVALLQLSPAAATNLLHL